MKNTKNFSILLSLIFIYFVGFKMLTTPACVHFAVVFNNAIYTFVSEHNVG